MRFTDLLRLTVLLLAAGATALAAVTVIAVDVADTATLIVGAAWWLIAVGVGIFLGTPRRASEGLARVLSSARTTPMLPSANPTRIGLGRSWPLVAFTLIAGGVGFVFPPVAAIGTGYALLVTLAWRNREAIVTGIEDRDGVRFYVESASTFEPVRLVRTPGLGRDRAPAGHPPPPPPAD